MLVNAPKRILITGAAGQLGQAVARVLNMQESYEVFAYDRLAFDITDEQTILSVIERIRPDVIINAAAYTAVDTAEIEVETVRAVNAEGVRYLARAANSVGVLLIHISTDYVFSGEHGLPYIEDDTPAPQTQYGLSKWLGEQAIAEEMSNYLILRTAWIFSEEGRNFVKTMLRLATERSHLSIVDDQVGGPTYAGDIAELILGVIERYLIGGLSLRGTYHFSGMPYVSWYQFAEAIFTEAVAQGVLEQIPKLYAISSSAYPTLAKRPVNSRLALDKVMRDFAIKPSDWQAALKQVISDYKNKIQEE